MLDEASLELLGQVTASGSAARDSFRLQASCYSGPSLIHTSIRVFITSLPKARSAACSQTGGLVRLSLVNDLCHGVAAHPQGRYGAASTDNVAAQRMHAVSSERFVMLSIATTHAVEISGGHKFDTALIADLLVVGGQISSRSSTEQCDCKVDRSIYLHSTDK